MAPRKRPRYKSIVCPMGHVVIDRVTRTWVVTDGECILDYGHQSNPGWTSYLAPQNRGNT
jgi:hypothetical protein